MKSTGTHLNFLVPVTRMLLVLSVGLALYIFYAMYLKPERALEPGTGLPEAAGPVTPGHDSDGSLQDFSGYSAVFGSRDVFEAPYLKDTATTSTAAHGAPGTEEQASQVDMSRDFKLVGIIIDTSPQAVVEDLKKKETVFLSLDDQLGEAVLKRILADRVVFQYQGREVELTP